MPNPKDFFFEGGSAGYFEEDQLPSVPGSYRYMPYRSPAHHRLHVALKTAGPQRCYYLAGNARRYFTVVNAPSPGVLELAGFVGGP